jgi:hypothetical protein
MAYQGRDKYWMEADRASGSDGLWFRLADVDMAHLVCTLSDLDARFVAIEIDEDPSQTT